MSSRTPTECVELATDSSASDVDRSDAIDSLKHANECDELAALARDETLEAEFRQAALDALQTPQCDSTLRELHEEDSLGPDLQDRASELLGELDGD